MRRLTLFLLTLMAVCRGVAAIDITPGRIYSIYNDNDLNGVDKTYYFSDQGGTLTITDHYEADDRYHWLAGLTAEGKYTFLNVATGAYMGFKAMSATPYLFTIEAGFVEGQYALYGDANSRYLVISQTGGFDQARDQYNKTTTNFSTDMVFTPVEQARLTITTSPAIEGVFTWNGQTKVGSQVTFSQPEGETVTGEAARIEAFNNGYSATLSADAWDGQGTLNVTATMTPDFFSSTYGEKWVTLAAARNPSYQWFLPDAEQGGVPRTAIADLTDDRYLWCFVGTASSFKIYNKAAGSGLSLKAASSSTSDGTNVAMAPSSQAWTLAYKSVADSYSPGGTASGYNIVLRTSRSYSLNSYGGMGGNLRFYGVNDGGSVWKVRQVSDGLSIDLTCQGETSPLNQLVGTFAFSADGTSYANTVSLASLGTTRTLYLPKAKEITIDGESFTSYKGYDYVGHTFDGSHLSVTYATTSARWLFQTYGKGRPYRIPAIATTHGGDLVALSDDRFCGADIGYGRVDIVGRISKDNGLTWSDEMPIATGDGVNASPTCGYGDAALVADAESERMMMMCVSAPNGGTCWTAAQRSVICWSNDGGQTWSKPIDIKDTVMKLLPTDRINYFVGSGKLTQSRLIKVGDTYRVYAALWTTSGGDTNNYVIYTDDFGHTWQLLGSRSVCPGPGGNEPKCEELPDGSVLLSARQPYHRLHNIYTYTDAPTGAGSWGTAATGINNGDGPNGTNGEILILPALRADGTETCVALQSAPNNGRAKVSLWWKELALPSDYDTPSHFGTGWTLGKEITPHSSAYSTMCLQHDGRIAFFYEDGQAGTAYDMVYLPLTLDELTDGLYTTRLSQPDGVQRPSAATTTSHTALYNLAGCRLTQGAHGIVVSAGRKELVP